MQSYTPPAPAAPTVDLPSLQAGEHEKRPVLSQQSQDSPLRLEYLDGLRGLVALYVVIYHVYRVLEFHEQWRKMPAPIQHLLAWTRYGHASVGIFIVLSGYCLMLPVVRSRTRNVKGGIREFISRRARRLLPPYFAALGFSLALLAIASLLQIESHHRDAHMASHFTSASLVSHVFLLHNLSNSTAYTINPAFWSVATEWQIYFLFPLLLLPLWRRVGLMVSVAAAFLVGLAPGALWPHRFDQACPWYLGLFALGMGGAMISLSDQPQWIRLRDRLPWLLLAAISAIACILLGGWGQNLDRVAWEFDTLVGFGTMSLLIACTARQIDWEDVRPSLLLRLLNSRPAVMLGSFSYSIYLIHYPLLDSAQFVMARLPISALLQTALFLGGVVPVTLFLAYAFHRIFERPFMPGRPRTERKAEEAAIVSPAP